MTSFLHTMIRVGNLEKSIEFYTSVLDLQFIRKHEVPAKKFTLVFLGNGPKEENILLELTHNWETDRYSLGEGFGHLAFGTSDLHGLCKKIQDFGCQVTDKPGSLKTSRGKNVAFAEDPDGYELELIETD